jgi:hypothetical protein
MNQGFVEATEIQMPKLKIAIVGDTGIGKSWLATSLAADDHKVVDLDFDGRAASLRGKKNVFIKSYIDKDPDSPSAMTELESDIIQWEYEASKGELDIRTFIIDSGTYMVTAIEKEAIRQQPSNGRSIIKLPGGNKYQPRTLKIGTGYDWAKINREYFANVIARLSAIGNLIVTFLDRDERSVAVTDDKGKTTVAAGFTGRVTIEPQHVAPVLATFNDVWYLHGEKGYRSLSVGLTQDFNIGKNTLGLTGEQYGDDLDIKKLLAKASPNGGGAVK